MITLTAAFVVFAHLPDVRAESPSKTITTTTSQALADAQAALEQRDASKALRLLEAYEGPAPAYAEHLRALADWAEGRRKAARKRWSALSFDTCRAAGPSMLKERVQTERAAVIAQEDPIQAAEALLSLPDHPHFWIQAAALLEKGGNAKRSRALMNRAFTRFPAYPEVMERTKRIGDQGVRERLKTIRARVERLRNLERGHANDQAAAESGRLARELTTRHPDRCEVEFIRGTTARKRRRYKEAARLLRSARQICFAKKVSLSLRAALVESRVRAILGQVRATRGVVDWMVRKRPRHRYTDDAQFLLAELLERKGRKKEARKLFAKIADAKRADHASIAAWRLAWSAIQKNDNKVARRYLAKVIDRETRPWDRQRAEYWLARLQEKKSPRAALDRYRALVGRPSFYGWLALERLRTFRPRVAQDLEEQLVAATRSAGQRSALDKIADKPAFLEAAEYASLGDQELAAWSVRRVGCRRKDPDTTLAIAIALDRFGARAEAQRMLRRNPRLLAEPFSRENVHRWRAAYSRAFAEEIQTAADAERLDPLLLTALVREESTFDPEVVSWAGATGLAQLMPYTAESAHQQVFKQKLVPSRLTEPALNVRLGAHVLRQGIRSFGHVVLGLGAYNGGHRLVRRNLSRKPVPFERWIEQFGVKETRRYMKRVTETWGIYRLLYDSKDPFVRLPTTIARRS